MSASHVPVLILDFGSQYTQLIARRIREQGVYCEVHPFCLPFSEMQARMPGAILLSGGPSSVYDSEAPVGDPRVFALGVPVLGICYGMQWMVHCLGGRVIRTTRREYGATSVKIIRSEGVFSRFSEGSTFEVWMSHGDSVSSVPEGFDLLGDSLNTPFCAIANPAKKLYGVQFHPEVIHTTRGEDVLAAFLFDVARLRSTWTSSSFLEEAHRKIQLRVEENEQAICALSGGVDSTVAAVLCHRALGDRLTCVFVDNGLLREGEAAHVIDMFQRSMHLPLRVVDARARFLQALEGVVDPEQKRKHIGRIFIEVFEEEARKLSNVHFLVQGTLYSDVIESVSVKGPSAAIKSHHNVGGLPETMKLHLLEPLRELFKDEVRTIGTSLGIPSALIARHPFPGPGLAIRCLGEVTPKRLAMLRKADAILEEEIRAEKLYASLWQSFCVLLPVRTVGVMGDERTYEEVCAVRAVHAQDGMTADWAKLPHDLLSRIASRIIGEVDGINRVVYDISSKPPATIEWE